MVAKMSPSLRQEYAFKCPMCHNYNLVRSEDPEIEFVCPDKDCGYIIWSTCKITGDWYSSGKVRM